MAHETSRTPQIADLLLLLRLLVGFLGQAKQAGWWNCSFIDPTGIRFLETTFPRTAKAAAIRSTTDAACLVHDKAIGRIGCFHLFRLPPAIEHFVDNAYERMDWESVYKYIESREKALAALQDIDDTKIKAPTGPVQVGVEKKIMSSNSISELAAHYYSAFIDGINCYPYFAADKNATK